MNYISPFTVQRRCRIKIPIIITKEADVIVVTSTRNRTSHSQNIIQQDSVLVWIVTETHNKNRVASDCALKFCDAFTASTNTHESTGNCNAECQMQFSKHHSESRFLRHCSFSFFQICLPRQLQLPSRAASVRQATRPDWLTDTPAEAEPQHTYYITLSGSCVCGKYARQYPQP